MSDELKQAAQEIVEAPETPAQEHSKSYLEDIREAYKAGIADARATMPPPVNPNDMPLPPRGPGFYGIAAPNPVPTQPDPTQPSSWSKDDISMMVEKGEFLSALKDHRRRMRGNIFPAKKMGKK
jgi:hypothetical protein